MTADFGKNDAVRLQIVASIREQWLSNLAHSLSNPLFAARGYIRMLQQNGRGFSEADKRYLGLALDNVDKLVPLVRGLELFSEFHELEFTSFGIRELLQEAAEHLRRSPGNGNLEVKEHLSPNSAVTIGDRAKLHTALEGFLTAAAWFAMPDGVLDISANEAGGRIAVQLTAGPERPGSGSEPDLAAAIRLWQLHGGRVSTSRTDKGYSLTCELPLIEFPQQPGRLPGNGPVQ